jgi:hypothetical protein
MLALYEANGKIVFGDRRFSGHKAIQDWYLRMFTKKLPKARFKLTKGAVNGSFYEIRWTAESKKGSVQNGRDLLKLQGGSGQTINYHYTEFDIAK